MGLMSNKKEIKKEKKNDIRSWNSEISRGNIKMRFCLKFTKKEEGQTILFQFSADLIC